MVRKTHTSLPNLFSPMSTFRPQGAIAFNPQGYDFTNKYHGMRWWGLSLKAGRLCTVLLNDQRDTGTKHFYLHWSQCTTWMIVEWPEVIIRNLKLTWNHHKIMIKSSTNKHRTPKTHHNFKTHHELITKLTIKNQNPQKHSISKHKDPIESVWNPIESL